MEILKQRIVLALKRSHKTQAEIARELKTTSQNVYNWKTTGEIRHEKLLPFAKATGVTTDWLLGCDIADLYFNQNDLQSDEK